MLVGSNISMALNPQFRVTKSRSCTTAKDEGRERLNDAIQAEGSLSITQAARLHVVSKTTLYRRINGRRDQVSYGITKQRLTPEGEDSIKSWVFEIQAWEFPPRVAQLREMGEELLQAKGDYKELGKKLGFRISQSPSYITSQIQPYSRSRSISSSESRYNIGLA